MLCHRDYQTQKLSRAADEKIIFIKFWFPDQNPDSNFLKEMFLSSGAIQVVSRNG